MTRTDFFRLFIPHPSLRYLLPCHAQCLQVFILTKTGRFPFRQQKRKIPAVHLPLLYGYFLFSSVLRIIRIIFMDLPCSFCGSSVFFTDFPCSFYGFSVLFYGFSVFFLRTAASSFISRALLRTVSVICTPPSIRASSWTLSSPSSARIVETVLFFRTDFSIR